MQEVAACIHFDLYMVLSPINFYSIEYDFFFFDCTDTVLIQLELNTEGLMTSQKQLPAVLVSTSRGHMIPTMQTRSQILSAENQ